MKKKLILISGSPCVGKTAVGTRLFESCDNSAYLDGDWCWCVHPFSVADSRLRNGDKSMSLFFPIIWNRILRMCFSPPSC